MYNFHDLDFLFKTTIIIPKCKGKSKKRSSKYLNFFLTNIYNFILLILTLEFSLQQFHCD